MYFPGGFSAGRTVGSIVELMAFGVYRFSMYTDISIPKPQQKVGRRRLEGPLPIFVVTI